MGGVNLAEQHTILSMLTSLFDGIHGIVDVDTIIGKPVKSSDNSIVIPVSKVSIGFGIGGSDFGKPKEGAENNSLMFGGGTGGGIVIEPVTFLVLSPDKVSTIDVKKDFGNLSGGWAQVALGLINLVKNALDKGKKDKSKNDKDKSK